MEVKIHVGVLTNTSLAKIKLNLIEVEETWKMDQIQYGRLAYYKIWSLIVLFNLPVLKKHMLFYLCKRYLLFIISLNSN